MWHYPHFIKWHSHFQKGLSQLTPSSFDVVFYFVTWCPVNICIFILYGINLHSSRVLWKYYLSRLHSSVRLGLMGTDHDFFSSPQNLFGLHAYVRQCCAKQRVMCVFALQVFFLDKFKKWKLFSYSACIQDHTSSNSPPSSQWLALIINNERITLNSRMPVFFQLTGQKETPTSLW